MNATGCLSCGADYEPGARFCSSCGAALVVTCPGCGTENPAAASFCSSCGMALAPQARRAAAAGGDQEERRVVSVLFADLAGSTALTERLDPEEVRELQGQLFALVADEVERHGGTTEKFVGDAVLAVFGIPSAHEDDAERAVRTALGIHERFGEFSGTVRDRHGADVELRIGISTGEVVSGRTAAARGELMVSGDAVNVAARLQQHAQPGTVLVESRTRLASARTIRYRDSPPIDAKGKSEPIEAWVATDIADAQRRPAVEGLSAPMIGRDEELAVLQALARRVRRERAPQLVTLYGQAGVGKSRLLAEFVAGLGETRILEGRCVPYDGVAYLPLAEAAKSHAGILDSDPSDVALAKLESALAAVLDEPELPAVHDAIARTIGLVQDAAGGEALGTRIRLHEAWVRFLTSLGDDELCLLVVEDIHWASDADLDLLEHLADALHATAVMIVCPSRPELLDSRPTWGAAKQNATALHLTPLRAAEAAVLVSELLGASSNGHGSLRERILERAEGNPFFVEEILRMLIDGGVLTRDDDGRWTPGRGLDEFPLPDTVHAAIAARLDLLEAGARSALRHCSVMGRVFWPTAVGVDEHVVTALARRELVIEQPSSVVSGMREFAFKHALTVDVAYGSLPRPERRELHVRVAEWLRAVAPDRAAEVAELAAHHYDRALRYGADDAGLVDAAFETALQASEAAIGRAAYSVARELAGRARGMVTDERRLASAEAMLGRVELAAADNDAALEWLEQAGRNARAAADRYLVSDILGLEARVAWLDGRWRVADESSAAAVAVLEGLPESPQLARALARRSQIEMLQDIPSAAESARHAVTVAGRVGDGYAEVNARINLFTAEQRHGVEPDAAAIAAIVDRATEIGAYDEAYRATVNLLWSLNAYRPLDEVEEIVGGLRRRLAAYPPPEAYESYLDVSTAKLVHVPAGRWDEADAQVRAWSRPAGLGSIYLVLHELIAGLALCRGDLATAETHLALLRERAPASGEPQRVIPYIRLAFAFAAVSGDHALVPELNTHLSAQAERNWGAGFDAYGLWRALVASGQEATLHAVLAGLRASRPMGVVPMLTSSFEGHAALLAGDADAAARHLADAVAARTRLGRHYEAAGCRLDLADAYEALGDERASVERAEARMLLDRLGCVNAY